MTDKKTKVYATEKTANLIKLYAALQDITMTKALTELVTTGLDNLAPKLLKIKKRHSE